MASFKFRIFSAVLLIQTLKLTNGGSVYQGCYPEDQRNRQYNVNPGDYDPALLTPTLCASTCGMFNKMYAALTYGRFCFCGDSPPVKTVVANTFCQVTCTGDAASKCGGVGYISLYTAARPIVGLALATDAVTIVPAGTLVYFDVSVTSGAEVSYQMDYDDGAGLSGKNATGFDNRVYHVPGTYSVRVEANDLNDTLAVQKAVTTVTVHAPAADMDIDCDPVFATWVEGTCTVTVWRGTSLSLTATVASLNKVDTFSAIADPVITQVGQGIPSKDTLLTNNDAGSSILALASLVERPGRIIGWEMSVQVPGTFKILVWSPSCGGGVYCPLSNACSGSCAGPAGVYAVSCPSFCPHRRFCYDVITCPTPSPRFSATTPTVSTYVVKQVVTVTATAAGFQYLAEPGVVDVAPGDVLGVDLDASGAARLHNNDCDLPQYANFKTAGTSVTGRTATGLTAAGYCTALRATVTEGSRVLLPYTFTSAGYLNVSVSASNLNITSSPVTNATQFVVMEGVNFTIMGGPSYVKSGVPTLFLVEPHTGSLGAVYTWDKGDATPIQVNTTFQSTNLTWAVKGTYNLTVTTANAVSSKTNFSQVIVQDVITGVVVTSPTAAKSEPHTFTITIATGSDFTCSWNFGDGTALQTTNPTTTPAGGASSSVPHTYATVGNKTVVVSCDNDVSTVNVTLVQTVQERITGLALSAAGQDSQLPFVLPWQVTTGTGIVWTVSIVSPAPYSMTVDVARSSPLSYRWVSSPMAGLGSNVYTVNVTAANAINTVSIAQPYETTTAISGFTASADTANTTTGQLITYTVNVTSGSNVNVSLQYQDGSSDSRLYPGDWGGVPVTFTHTFQNGGYFQVSVMASNPAGPRSVTLGVLVLVGVSGVQMHAPSYALYAPPAYVDVWFDVSAGSPAPTNPELALDFNYVSDPLTDHPLQLGVNFTQRYDDIGLYTLRATVSNMMDSKLFVHQLYVLEVFQGGSIRTEYPKAPRGLLTKVFFALFRGPQSPYCNLTWSYGDSAIANNFSNRIGSGMNGEDWTQVNYSTIGTYTVTVTATSPLQQITATRSVQVVEPVLNESITITDNSAGGRLVWDIANTVTLTVTYSASSPVPYTTYIDVLWGDGSVEVNTTYSIATNRVKDLSHIFTVDGLSNTRVRIWNDASSVTRVLETGVYKHFLGLTTKKCFTPDLPANSPCLLGLDVSGNLFSASYPIQFDMFTTNNAKASYYSVTAVNGAIVCNKTTNPFFLNITDVGTWTVNVDAVNPLETKTAAVATVRIIQQVAGFTVSHNASEKTGGIPKSFTIGFELQGTETCLLVDFGDNKFEIYADDISYCQRTGDFSGVGNVAGALTGRTAISHKYLLEKTYVVALNAHNRYSSVTKQLNIEISGLDCSQPQVDIYNKSQNFEMAVPYLRGQFTIIRGQPLIACSSFDNVKSWSVHIVDEDWGNATGAVSLPASVCTNQSELSLPPWTLSYGLYKATFSMAMTSPNPSVTFWASTYTFIRIGRSDLVGMMVSGGTSDMRMGTSNGNIMLTPLAYSYDPDVQGRNPAMSNLNVISWTCNYKNGTVAAECNMLRSAGTNGPNGRLTYPVASLVAGNTYTINATLRHADGRSTRTSLNLQVVTGDIPVVTIRCSGGSVCYPNPEGGFFVLASSRLNLMVECSNCNAATDVLYYKWNISLANYRWPNGWRPLQPIDISKNRTVGAESDEISIQSSLFEAFPQYRVYEAECEVTRGGAVGGAAIRFTLNEPPVKGSCSITPEEQQVSREKLFLITCSNWTDDNGIRDFQFFSFFHPEDVQVQITSVKTALGKVNTTVTLPQGAYYIGYNNTVRVIVTDTMGASTVMDIDTVRVTPAESTAIRSMSTDILTNPSNELSKLIAEGDLISVTEYATSVMAMLNSDKYLGVGIAGTQASTALGPYDSVRPGAYQPANRTVSVAELNRIDTERDTRAEVRNKVIEAVAQLPFNTMLARDQIMSTLLEAARITTELRIETRETMLNMVEKFSEMLSTGEEVTPEQRDRNMEYMIGVVGATMDSMGTTGFEPTKTERLRSMKEPEFADYDTENTAPDNDCLALVPPVYDFDAALKRQAIIASCMRTKKQVAQAAARAVRVMDNIRNSFINNSIDGEDKQFNTDRQKTKLQKASAKTVLGAPQKMRFSEAEFSFPSDLNDIFPGASMSENQTLVMQFSETSNSPMRYSKLGHDIPKGTRFVSFDLFGDTGHRLVVKNMTKPVRIKIPRTKDQAAVEVKAVDPLLATWNKFQLHKTQVTKQGSSLHATLCPAKADLQYVVVINFGEVPDPDAGKCVKAFLVPENMSDPRRPACTVVYLDNLEIRDFIGPVFLGVRELNASEHGMDVSNCTGLPRWTNGTGNGAGFSGNYTLQMFGSGCYSINDGDGDWSTQGCRVCKDTNNAVTVCECTHLTTFAGGWVVVPNTIDWNYVFSNMDFMKNPTLYITEIVIAAVYIIALIWARRKDRKDVETLGIAPMLDNDLKDRYYYEIVVVTGMRRNAGTNSNVFFILSGEEDETDVRHFSDSKRKIFRRGGTNGFLMAVSRPLGYLNYARIWHDNSGKGANGGWYLNYMIVRDVQTDEKWVFIADRWFAVEEDDGQVDRIVPVATREAMTEFGHMFAERTRRNLADGHLWFSVLARPPASRFTCVQRVSCCLCLLYVSMLASAMFYRKDGASPSPSNGVTIGPFSLSPEQVFIGIASNVIVFPVTLLIISLFRKARPRKLRPSRVDEAIKTAYDGPRMEASVNDVKPEVSSIFSISRPTSTMSRSAPRPESSLSRPGTSLSARADGALPTKKKSKDWPWWCRILGWLVLWVSTLTSAAFVTFYGVSFADETCKKWITSMLMAFFMSVFITQPIKVFLTAIVLSLIIKNPGEEEEEEETIDEERTKLASDEIPLHDLDPESYGAARPRKIGYKPLDRKAVEAAREQRMKEIQMWAVVREVVIYSFFLWILLLISYRQRNANTFLYKDTMERTFIMNGDTDVDFNKIYNTEDFWNWTRSGLLKGIRAGPYYNDYPPVLLRGYVNDKVSKILGYATMRQLRIRPSQCELDERMLAVIRECNIGYEVLQQEEGNFDVGWKKLFPNTTTDNETITWYRYADASELDGYPYWGQLGVYSGGGYVIPLLGSKQNLTARMNVLQSQEWIDRYTRAVFVEFTTYNAQVNLFGIATILAEFTQAGGIVRTYRFEPAMLLPYMTNAMLFQLVCEGIFCLFILFFMYKLIRAFFREKLAFIKSFWNLVELGIVAVSIGGVFLYFYRLVEANKLTRRFKETEGLKYLKFQYVGYWNEVFTYMLGWLTFFATLKFLKLLRFNKRISLLSATLKNGAKSMLHFGIIFWIVFLAFSMLFFVTFKNVDASYSSFIRSVVSLILMMMGKIDISTLTMAEPVLAQIFVFLFVVSVTFIIVNMFVSILNETFSAVREDVSKQANDYELVTFMLSRFKKFTGIGGSGRPVTLTPEELKAQEEEKKHTEGRGNSCVDDFPDRIDRLLHSISNVYMDDAKLTGLLDKKGYQRDAVTGFDNPSYTGPKGSKTVAMSKVHTH